MTNVITFTDITPPARTDGVAWTKVTVAYAPEKGGEYGDVETIDLLPLDADPSVPLTRTFATTLAPASEGWFRLTFTDMSSNKQSLDEFFIQSSPTSEIAALVRSMMPSSYSALASATNYGEPLIRLRIEAAKHEKLPLALAALDESAYTFLLKEYIACVAAMQLIPAAIEHWMRMKTQWSTTGTNESATLPDPIEHLKMLEKRLLARISQLEANPNLLGNIGSSDTVPAVDTDGQDYITADPFTFPPAFDTGTGAATDV